MTSVKKAFDSGAIPASQSEHLSYAEKFFGIQRYSSLPSGDGKKPRRRTAIESLKTPPLRLPRQGLSRCNITTVRYEKKARRTDWSGRERTSESKRFGRLYIAIETNIQIKKQTVGQIFIGIIIRTCG